MRIRLTFAPFVLLLSFALTGCPESTTPEDDAGTDAIMFDASLDTIRPDTNPEDTGEPESDIGGECTDDGDCDGFCNTDFPGGYCSNTCGSAADCPEGAACSRIGCLAGCTPGAGDCRRGYGCTTNPRFGNVCVPGCEDDDDCGDGEVCDPTRGFAGGGECFSDSANVGDACESDRECPVGGLCLAEEFQGWPAGSCITFGCDVPSNMGCEGDAVCIAAADGTPLCIDGCEEDGDCRDGYVCEGGTRFPDRAYCQPGCTSDDACSDGRVCNPGEGTCDVPFDANELGTPCSTVEGACAGGRCLTEFSSGWPGSVCVFAGCDLDAPLADNGCPGDGACMVVDGDAVCVDGCEEDGDCRTPSYTCADVDDEDASKGRGCQPSCSDDDHCANRGGGGSPTFVCNVGTGLCDYGFDDDTFGNSCSERDECRGGSCLDEFDGGFCAARGCRLSGEGPEEECPSTGTCVDDGDEDEIGHCLLTCTDGGDECGEGLTCADDLVCRP